MKITILNEEYSVIDTKEKTTIADSFVVRQNKIGRGNGEAKLYVGNDNEFLRNFFGRPGFILKCFLLKKDLLKYLEETKVEYLHPEQPYINKTKLPTLWQERFSEINSLPDKITFEIKEETQISGPRIYIKSLDPAYDLIRKISLPNITFIAIVKLLNKYGNIEYYFRLFADYFGDEVHPFVRANTEKELIINQNSSNKSQGRLGQRKYREKLLHLCPYCPITMVADDRLLIASHIKPWIFSNEVEKIDPYNGFMFTPTFDYLFDRGFLSFTDDKKSILSPFLSKMTYSKLGISDSKTFSLLPTEGREKYLKFHRESILKI